MLRVINDLPYLPLSRHGDPPMTDEELAVYKRYNSRQFTDMMPGLGPSHTERLLCEIERLRKLVSALPPESEASDGR